MQGTVPASEREEEELSKPARHFLSHSEMEVVYITPGVLPGDELVILAAGPWKLHLSWATAR